MKRRLVGTASMWWNKLRKKDSNPKEISNSNFCHECFIGAVTAFLWKTEVEGSVVNFSDL